MNINSLLDYKKKYLNKNLVYSDRGHIMTECVNKGSENLDILTTIELVKLFSKEDLCPQRAVQYAIPEIVTAIDLIVNRIKKGGRLFYLGAGTSGRLGVLDAAECPPTFCTPKELVQAIIAGGKASLINSSEKLEDQENLAINDLISAGFKSKDCLIGISAGGTTPYVKSALKYTKSIEALSIAMTCVPLEHVKFISDIDIRLLTGPELLTGSTRLKAGTATKMALNIISTSVMIKLGKVYGNKMIDVSASNNKLIDRSLRIILQLTEIEKEEAIDFLIEARGSVKVALLMIMSDLRYKEATKLLDNNDQNLRKALKSSL